MKDPNGELLPPCWPFQDPEKITVEEWIKKGQKEFQEAYRRAFLEETPFNEEHGFMWGRYDY